MKPSETLSRKSSHLFSITIERDGEEDEIGQYLSALVNKTRLFLTEQGYLGTAPSSVQMGDCVVLSPHSRLPVVLRKRGSFYQNIGPCFILGLMDGEGLTNSSDRIVDSDT
jgi:hypothetical protein